MEITLKHKGDAFKGAELALSPVELLAVERSLYEFSSNSDFNSIDREIAEDIYRKIRQAVADAAEESKAHRQSLK